MLNLTGRLVVVVGGGEVGMRKAAAALAAGAIVRVVDRAPQEELRSLTLPARHEPELIAEPYRAEHLDGAHLVFACATPEVNAQVVTDAHARKLWVNSATNPTAGDFTLPSVHRVGELTFAISTGGAAPALARRIREKLEKEFDTTFADWVRVLAEVRAIVLAEVADPAHRRELLDNFASWPWLERLRADGAETVHAAMLAKVRAKGS
jgi:precorrin-2 dehydrogenase/sirohydrochlorin ferrochelatase